MSRFDPVFDKIIVPGPVMLFLDRLSMIESILSLPENQRLPDREIVQSTVSTVHTVRRTFPRSDDRPNKLLTRSLNHVSPNRG